MFDFRSDTVTRPTAAMLAAMAHAPLGDDVLGDDPTVQRLEGRVAELLGKEAAVFVPTGTMSNLIAVFLHCRAGDEFLCDAGAHVYIYEQAGYAQICGVAVRTLTTERGQFDAAALRSVVRPENIHFPRTKALFLEQTHNRGGGSLWDAATLEAVCAVAREHQMACHLDGARLWNAVVATGRPASAWAAPFNTVSICFSKGLGAPAGSVLVGSREAIALARRRRKVLGGGMRQSGVLAAACLYALDHHVERLHDDHQNARVLADAIRSLSLESSQIHLKYDAIDTNIVYFDTPTIPATELCERLAARGVLFLPIAPHTTRGVFHRDVDRAATQTAVEAIRNVMDPLRVDL